MMNCPKCGAAMIRAERYDPDGSIPLYGGVKNETEWWVCINEGCEDGNKNRTGQKPDP